MVGRLVEQQDVGLRRHDAGKGGAARLAAGKIVRASPRRSGRDVPADRWRGRDRRRAPAPPRHRRARWRNRPCRASAADSARSPRAGGTPRHPAARSGRRRSSAASTCRSRCGRPARSCRRPRHRQFGAVKQRRAAEGQHDPVEIEKRRGHVVRTFRQGVGVGKQQRTAAAQGDVEVGPCTSLEMVSDEPNGNLDTVERPFARQRRVKPERSEKPSTKTACRRHSRNRHCPAAAECLPVRRWSEAPHPAFGQRAPRAPGAGRRGRHACRRRRRREPGWWRRVRARLRSASSPSVLSLSGGNVWRGTAARSSGKSAGTESKSPTQSSGITPSIRAWPMPASAAMTRVPVDLRGRAVACG